MRYELCGCGLDNDGRCIAPCAECQRTHDYRAYKEADRLVESIRAAAMKRLQYGPFDPTLWQRFRTWLSSL